MTWTGQRLVAAMGLAGALALGGCAYDDGYYGGVSVGTGYYSGGYYDDYWGSGYYRPGYYGGWYDGWYYPGTGYYVYDRDGRRHRWNEGQRRYWEGRRNKPDRNWSGTREQWQGKRGDWHERQAPRQGERGRSGGRWRDGSSDAAPANPPVTQSQPNVTSPRRDWGTRSDGGRWRGSDGERRGGDVTRPDGRRSWRR